MIIIFPYLFIVGIFQLIGYFVTGMNIVNFNAPKEIFQELIISFFSFIGTILTVWLFVWKFDNERFWDIGLSIKNRAKDICYGLACGLLIMLIGFMILIYLKEINITTINFITNKFVFSLLLFMLVALQEEIIVRGYILNNLMKSMNRYLALIISALFFSILHIPNPHSSLISFLNITLAGLLLGLSYIYTRNLWFPIALHFSWNFVQGSILGFSVSGQSLYSLVVQHRMGNTLLNGGAFGFEGSVVCLVLQAVAIVVVWRVYDKELKAERVAS